MHQCSLCSQSPGTAVQGAAMALSDSIDRNTPAKVPERCSEAPSVAGVERILALAHRLSYTSFAPPGVLANCTSSERGTSLMQSADQADWGHTAPAGAHQWQSETPCMEHWSGCTSTTVSKVSSPRVRAWRHAAGRLPAASTAGRADAGGAAAPVCRCHATSAVTTICQPLLYQLSGVNAVC